MDLVGEFHKVEIDGKPFLVYHNVKNQPNSTVKAAIDSGGLLLHQPLYLCPVSRIKSTLTLVNETWEKESEIFLKFETSSSLDDDRNDHHVLPLFWCNNKEVDPFGDCDACRVEKLGTDYYFCVKCDKKYHKECVESPLEITFPSHIKHSLYLYFSQNRPDNCIFCKRKAHTLVYYCSLCDIYMHVLCAQKRIPFLIDQPQRHDHTLTLFPRQTSLTCNLCGLVDKLHLTYVCAICDFVAHGDCIYIPQTIRISRHNHRIFFISCLPVQGTTCGVCRQEVDSDYGAYTCGLCSGYVVHTRCALRKDIWDGKELEGVLEEEDVYEDVEPFKRRTEGIISHFSHGHDLRFETFRVYNENKICQACVLPIYEGNFYACDSNSGLEGHGQACVDECNFILHETCANAPRTKLNPLHPHPLTLEDVPLNGIFRCDVCTRLSTGFVYGCTYRESSYQQDMQCALISEPFTYQGHKHPLFLALDPRDIPMCHICKSRGKQKVLNCIECDFIICFKCATLPYKARYKHDEHYLTFCHGDEVSDSDWCELCERKLAIGGREGFYECKICCTTLHISCLLGKNLYLKHGHSITLKGGDVMHIRLNDSLSRPICFNCYSRCSYLMLLERDKQIFCCLKCALEKTHNVLPIKKNKRKNS